MFWPAFVFNLCVALLLAAYLLRAVRRFERRADAVAAKLDQWEAEEIRKFDVARDEIRDSMRARVDAAIARMEDQISRNSAELRELTARGTDESPSATHTADDPFRTESVPR